MTSCKARLIEDFTRGFKKSSLGEGLPSSAWDNQERFNKTGHESGAKE